MSVHKRLTTFAPKSLNRRVLLISIPVLLGIAVGLTTVLYTQVRNSARAEFNLRAQSLTTLLANETWLAFQDHNDFPTQEEYKSHLEKQTKLVVRDEDVVYAIVRDEHEVVIASAMNGVDPTLVFGEGFGSSNGIQFRIPLCLDHSPFVDPENSMDHADCTHIGSVGLGLSTVRTLGAMEKAYWNTILLACLLSAVAVLGLLLMMRWALQPVRAAVQVARRLARGDLSAKTEWEGQGEMGEFADVFNAMSWDLADSREELAERNRELQLGVAEKERLYQNARVRATRLEVMNGLAKAIAASLDPEEIFANVHKQLDRLMQFEYFTIQRFIPDRKTLRRDYLWVDHVSVSVQQGQELKAESSPIRRVKETKAPLSIPDFDEDRQLSEGWLYKEGFRSGFLVPIVARDEFLGCLGMACRRKNAFDSIEVATVFAVAEMVAVVLKNAELHQQLQTSFSELRETQKRLLESEHVKRAEKMRSIGQMTSGIAHNFNNVMSAIIGRAQLIQLRAKRNQIDMNEILSGMEVIERAALDGAETVRRLQEFSRDSVDLKTKRCDLNDLIRSVVEITRPRWRDQAQQGGVNIELKTELESLPPVTCVPGQLREVLTNLIFNAVDALPQGGDLIVRTYRDDLTAVIQVRDTGTGIPDEIKDHIFDPFFTTKGVSGNGLGLSTVYGIIKRHGGEIHVSTAENEGTTFDIRLPLAKSHRSKSTEECMQKISKSWRILVGDDEENVREALADLLRILGHEVYLAHDGRSTVKAFAENTFDMVFTDLGMPDLSGWEVARKIRDLDEDVPIVLATGWGTQIDHSNKDYGVTRVLGKPFTIQKLASLIAELQSSQKAA